jgi:hypothetical protein
VAAPPARNNMLRVHSESRRAAKSVAVTGARSNTIAAAPNSTIANPLAAPARSHVFSFMPASRWSGSWPGQGRATRRRGRTALGGWLPGSTVQRRGAHGSPTARPYLPQRAYRLRRPCRHHRTPRDKCRCHRSGPATEATGLPQPRPARVRRPARRPRDRLSNVDRSPRRRDLGPAGRVRNRARARGPGPTRRSALSAAAAAILASQAWSWHRSHRRTVA